MRRSQPTSGERPSFVHGDVLEVEPAITREEEGDRAVSISTVLVVSDCTSKIIVRSATKEQFPGVYTAFVPADGVKITLLKPRAEHPVDEDDDVA